jgi:Ion channel
MLQNIVVGLSTMVACLFLQALLIVVAARYYARFGIRIRGSFRASLAVITGVMLLLVVGNLLQVAVWALLFRALGEFDEFGVAFYHSAVNFSTLGYGDIVMSPQHRLLGPFEAINGALMIGVTSAALITAFHDVKKGADETRGGPDART